MEMPWIFRSSDDVLCARSVPEVHLTVPSPEQRVRYEAEMRNERYVARYYQRRANHAIKAMSRNWEATA